MVAHHLEIERKYELTDLSAQAPVINWQFDHWAVDAPVLEELDATYFDTAQGWLGAHGVALRRRMGGYDQGWHIKFDVSGGRHEVSFDLAENPEDMPDEAQRFVGVLTAGSALEPRVGLATRRSRTVIRSATGEALAEICDDSVRSVDYVTGIERSWQEWEVELLEGAGADSGLAQSLFSEVGERLLAAGAWPSSSPAKIARALGKDADFERRLAQSLGQLKSGQALEASHLAADSSRPEMPATPVDVLAHIVSCYSIKLGQADLLARVGLPDSTHQGRVVARQLRSVLMFMAIPYARDRQAKERLRAIVGGLKTYASELEGHRNGELILPMTQQGLARTGLLDDSDLGEIASLGRQQTQAGWESAIAYLNSSERVELQQALYELVEDLEGAVELPARSKKYGAQVARRLQKKIVKRGEKAVKTWPASAEEFAIGDAHDEAIHDMRKLAKAARYCLVAYADAGMPLSSEQESFLKKARLLQAELGELTDELTFLDWLKELGKSSSTGLDSFTVGCLAGRSECVAEGLRAEVYSSVPRVLKKIKAIDF